MEEKQLGMRWLTVYTILFGVKILSSIFSTITIIMACAEYNLFTDFVGVAGLLLATVETIYLIFTFIHFCKRTALGYTLNMIYIFLDVFISAINVGFSRAMDTSTNVGHIWGILFATVALLLIWSWPNYIYFKNRKFLFSGTLKDKQISTDSSSHKKTTPAAANIADADVTEITNQQNEVIQVDALKTLKELHDDNIITDEEFAEKKKKILGI